MAISRTINADKAGFLEHLEDQRAEWQAASDNTRLTLATRREYVAKAEGLEWAIRAVRDWSFTPDGSQPSKS
jgi:hypothetical protein